LARSDLECGDHRRFLSFFAVDAANKKRKRKKAAGIAALQS
jgi:hypothetical protein